MSLEGVITGFSLTSANGSERDAVWDLIDGVKGLLIGDKGYLSSSLKRDLAVYGIDLQTPKRSNMVDYRDRNFVRMLIKTRRLVETIIGQRTERFNIETVRARDLWHLTIRINRQLLSHTVALWLNRHSNNPLRFQNIISD